jgi:hypothetical protein
MAPDNVSYKIAIFHPVALAMNEPGVFSRRWINNAIIVHIGEWS